MLDRIGEGEAHAEPTTWELLQIEKKISPFQQGAAGGTEWTSGDVDALGTPFTLYPSHLPQNKNWKARKA